MSLFKPTTEAVKLAAETSEPYFQDSTGQWWARVPWGLARTTKELVDDDVLSKSDTIERFMMRGFVQ